MSDLNKDFDSWNSRKKIIDRREIQTQRYFHEGEIWWASLGLNIGYEQDGKHEAFERPVLIVRKFSRHMVWILPLTTTQRSGAFYYTISKTQSSLILSQLRTLSTKRMLRYIWRMSDKELSIVIQKLISLFAIKCTQTKSPQDGDFSGDLRPLIR